MGAERTLAIVKPDAVAKNLIGKIIAHLEAAGFVVTDLQMTRLSEPEARRCRTPSISPASPTTSATTATGSPSTTAAAWSRAPRPRC